MKILIVEDSSERIAVFKRNLIGHNIHVACSAEQAYKIIEAEDRFDYIFLDHDLCGGTYEPSDNNSGYGVAKYIASYPEKHPHRAIIHSLNPSGASNIHSALEEAGIICNKIPFAWTKLENGISEK